MLAVCPRQHLKLAMSMLVFLPWAETHEQLAVGAYTLVPYKRGEKPGGEQQPEIDLILSPYLASGRPVSAALLIRVGNHGLLDDLSDDERSELFSFGELLAFAGLACREHFGHFDYVNRDTFSMIIQSFTASSGGVAVQARRRDGSTLNYIKRDQYKVPKPEHVTHNGPVKIAADLLESLLKARDMDSWHLFHEAIFSYSRGNTDSDAVTEQAETVMMVGAFERLLDCRHGNENELAQRFSSEWKAARSVVPETCERIPERDRSRTIREGWIRDFFRYRNHLSHGRRASAVPQIWTLEEHLLLGAYAFPLLVKQMLAASDLYKLSDNDQIDIDVFEKLACCRIFERLEEHDGRDSWPWTKIRGEERWDRAVENAIKKAEVDLGVGRDAAEA